MRIFAATLLSVLALSADTALADDDRRCGSVGAADWMSVADISARAEATGLTVREVERDDGCYEVKGTNSAGQRVELHMHPASGAVVKTEIDD